MLTRLILEGIKLFDFSYEILQLLMKSKRTNIPTFLILIHKSIALPFPTASIPSNRICLTDLILSHYAFKQVIIHC